MLKGKDRLNFLEIEEVSGAAGPAEAPRGAGLRLAQARESAGYSLAEVAGYLRVRKNYLEAIENERYDALPGRTYAIGFVRAYAELLGLDAARLVNDFKAETTALKGRTELVFPSPPPEGRIPGGAILFVSVLVALLAYGGWYYISVTEKGVAELVPAVPDRLVALLEGGRAAVPVAQEEPSSRQAIAATARDEEPPLPAPGSSVSGSSVSGSSAGISSAPAAPALEDPAATRVPAAIPAPIATRAPVAPPALAAVSPAPAPSVAVPPAVPAASAPAAPALAAAAPASAGASAGTDAPAAGPGEEERTPEPSSISGNTTETGPMLAAREPAAGETPAPPAASPPPASATPATPSVTPPAAPPSVAPAATQTMASLPAAGGASSSASQGNTPAVGPRIVLHATDEVWLQIRDGDSALVTRILRKGDSYRVPNRSGLTLLTGNAGALEILVDGRPAPTLGPLGAVRRDVALDPQALLAGADARQ